MTDDGDEHDGIDPKQIFINENICNYQWAMNAGEGETETSLPVLSGHNRRSNVRCEDAL